MAARFGSRPVFRRSVLRLRERENEAADSKHGAAEPLPLPTEKVSPPKIKQNFSPDSLSELNKILNERDHNVSELWRGALRSGGLEVPAVSVVGGFQGGKLGVE